MRARASVLLVVVLAASHGFALSAGPELAVATPVIEPAPFDRSAVAVASNGSGFAVVWQDRFDIRAARVTSDGEVLDRPSLRVANGTHPVIASDGDQYVIAHNCTSSGLAVCVERFDPSSGAIGTAATIANATNAAIASNGDGYLLVYQVPRANGNFAITAVALARDGSLAAAPFEIVTAPYPPAVASNGSSYFVIWSSYSLLHGVLTSSTEVISSRQQLSATLPSFGPGPFGWSVASDGHDYLAAWQQNRGVSENRYTTDLRVARVSENGVADPEQIVTDDLEPWLPAVAWTGSRYLLSVTKAGRSGAPYIDELTPSDVWSFAVDASGHYAGEGALAATANRERASALASNGTTTLIAWVRSIVSGRAEIEATLRPNAPIADAPQPVFTVSYALTWQDSPAAMRSGSQTVVAWDENHGDAQLARVVVARLGGPALPVAPSDWDQRRPALSARHIVWVEEDPTFATLDASVRAQRLDSNGAPVGEASTIGTARRGSRVAIATIETTELVVWQSSQGITGVLIDGDEVSAPIAISSHELVESMPDVAANGSRFLVAWNREVPPVVCAGLCFPQHSLHSVAITREGTLASATVEVAPIEAADPRVVWDGAEFTIFWSGSDELTGEAYIGARKMSAGGYPLSEARKLAIGTTLHAVTWSGNEFFAATTTSFTLSLVRLERDLDVIDTTPLSSRHRVDARAAVVSHAPGNAVVVYLDRGSEFVSSRAVSRRVGDDVTVPRRRSIR